MDSGVPEGSLQTAQRALDRARELAHPVSIGLALHFACHVHELRREWASAGRLADELMALGAQHRIAHFQAWASTQRGAILIGHGKVSGIARMHRGLDKLRSAGDEAWRPFYDTLLAGALKASGRNEKALAVLDDAVATVGAGQRMYEAEVHRVAGELLFTAPGRRAEAEAHLAQALEVARKQQARSWELRAATDLARQRLAQHRPREANALLEPIHTWFTEGFDTPDLQAARTLLDGLL